MHTLNAMTVRLNRPAERAALNAFTRAVGELRTLASKPAETFRERVAADALVKAYRNDMTTPARTA
jgi:hypothetical protein